VLVFSDNKKGSYGSSGDHHDGWVTYYIAPVEHAEDIVDINDVYEKEAEDAMEEIFRDPIAFAEWARENPEIEITSYWETREI